MEDGGKIASGSNKVLPSLSLIPLKEQSLDQIRKEDAVITFGTTNDYDE